MKKYNFKEFLDQWNIYQNYTTPSIHVKIANWLQHCYETGQTRLLLMAFRACGKSTLIGLFSAWLLYRQPDTRILVLAAESSLASKMARNIRMIIEQHPLTPHLVPLKKDQWASDRFTINRTRELRDPSVLSFGITANITGSRADIIIYDDVEVPNTSNSVDKRESLRDRLRESNFILVPGGTQLYVGTPHSYFSIYAERARTEIGEEEIFLNGFKRYKQPILNKRKQSVWPEQFSQDIIDIIRKQAGPNKFAAQMMLQPVNILSGRLNTELLRYYTSDLTYSESRQQVYLSIDDKKLVSCTAWWDPAFGVNDGVRRDSSVLAIVFTDALGSFYLHHLEYISILPNQKVDEATLQCLEVANLVRQYFIPSLAIEINGIGKLLPGVMKRVLSEQNIPCAVLEKSSTQKKSDRILEAFDAPLAAQALNIHDSVKNTPFILEMTEWQPSKKYMRDDGLDAVAGALSLEPIRIQRSVVTAQRKWFSGGQSFKAETDFKV